jgi:hypothetical protein
MGVARWRCCGRRRGRYSGFQLKLPEDPQDYFAFGLIFLVATWIVVFVIRIMGAPARMYANLQDNFGKHQTTWNPFEPLGGSKFIMTRTTASLWPGNIPTPAWK